MAKRPADILFLMTDQLNPHCLGCTGNRDVQTPNLDALAAEGCLFEECYSVSPVCVPARCSMVSGRYPHNTGIWHNMDRQALPPSANGLFRDLRAAGYRTVHCGKSHWSEHGFGRHYDEFQEESRAAGIDAHVEIPGPHSVPFYPSPYSDHLARKGLLAPYLRSICEDMAAGGLVPFRPPVEPEDHNDGMVARSALEQLASIPADQPVFLHASFPGPHTPLDPPGEYFDQYDPDGLHLPPNVPETCRRSYGAGTGDRAFVRRCRAAYYGKISHIDHWIGRIVEGFKARGTWDRTLVVFCADHGDHMGAHGLFGKCTFYDESVRVPLVLRWPGVIPAGTRNRALVEIIDLYPTLVAAAGGAVTQEQYGRDLLPVACGEVQSVRETVFSEIGQQDRSFMVLTERWKYVARSPGGERLWDRRADPCEQEPRKPEEVDAAVLQDLRERLRLFLMRTTLNETSGYRPLFERAGVSVHEDGMADRLEALAQTWYGTEAPG